MAKNRFRIKISEQGNLREIIVEKDSFVLGRAPSCDIHINDDRLSRAHIEISIIDQTIWISDLGSRNGTWIDNKKVTSKDKVAYLKNQVITLANIPNLLFMVEYVQVEQPVINQIRLEDLIPIEIPDEELFEVAPVIPIVTEKPQVLNKTTTTTLSQPMVEKKVVNGPSVMPKAVPIKKPVTAPVPQMAAKDKLVLLDTLGIIPENTDRVEKVSREKSKDKKQSLETDLLENIKNLLKSEAEEIRIAALDEAKKIQAKAEIYALGVIQEVKDKAIAEAAQAKVDIDAKLEKLHQEEFVLKNSLQNIADDLSSLEYKQIEMKDLSVAYQEKLTQLQEEITNNEDRIHSEKAFLHNLKMDIENHKEQLDEFIRETTLKEAQILENLKSLEESSQNKIKFYQEEVEKAHALKKEIEPVVDALKSDHYRLESELKELQTNRSKEESSLRKLKVEFDLVLDELDQTRKNQDKILLNITIQKNDFLKFQTELEAKDQELKFKTTQYEIDSRVAIQTAQNEAIKIKETAQKEVEQLKFDIDRLKTDLSQEREQRLSSMTKEYEEAKINHTSEIAALMERRHQLYQQAELRIKKQEDDVQELKNLIKLDRQKIIDEAHTESESMKQLATLQSQNMIDSAETKAKTLKQESENQFNQFMNDLQFKKKEAQKNHQDVLHDFQNQIEQIHERKKQAEHELVLIAHTHNEKMQEANKNAEQIMFKVQEDAKDYINKTKQEAADIKKKEQAVLTELKHGVMLEIKEQRQREEEDVIKRKNERAKQASGNVFAYLTTEMLKFKDKSLSESEIYRFNEKVKDVVADTLMDNYNQDATQLQKILKTSVKTKEKDERFWRHATIYTGSVSFVLILLLAFPQIITYPKNKIIAAFQDQGSGSSDAFLAQVKEARARSVYTPKTTPEYKSSYIENIIFTTDFLKKKEDQAFHDKWVLELNDYFIYKLDVKDTTIIKFVSLETNFIKEIVKLKDMVDPTNPEPKLEEMRAKEEEFKQKLSHIFEDPTKVERFYKFSEDFWKKFHKK